MAIRFAVFLLLLALTSFDQAIAETYPSPGFDAVISRCEQAVREKVEVPRSVSFGEILYDYNGVMRQGNYTLWMIHGAFTQQVGNRFVVPHFYICAFSEGKITVLDFYTGHASDYDNTASRAMCRQAVAQRTEVPNSAHFRLDKPESASGTLPAWKFSGTVDLLNASGSFSRHRYSCRVYHGEIIEFELTEED